MRQERLTREDQEREKPGYPAIFEQRKQTSGGFESQSLEVSALDVDEHDRNAHFEALWHRGGLRFCHHNFAVSLTNRAANRPAYDFFLNKFRAPIAAPHPCDHTCPSKPHPPPT